MDHLPPSPFTRRRPLEQRSRRDGPLFVPQPAQIRVATVNDLKFVDHLQRKFANAVGFLPKVAIENLTQQGHVRIAMENDEGAGYILSRPRLGWQPKMRSITQACVAMDAQRRHHGIALLHQIEIESIAAGLLAIQACCAVGLESNDFWKAAGFVPVVHMTPQNVRGREIICWRKPLVGRLPSWFAMPPRLAGHRAKRPTFERNPNRDADALSLARSYIV